MLTVDALDGKRPAFPFPFTIKQKEKKNMTEYVPKSFGTSFTTRSSEPQEHSLLQQLTAFIALE